MNVLSVKRINSSAILPSKAHEDDVGYDLYADEEVTINPRDRKLVKTGLQIKVPSDCYGRIAPRSGLATQYKIDVAAGVVDKNYRGEVCVCLVNCSDVPVKLYRGSRIAQLICEKVRYPELIEVENLDETDRCSSGFGSSGL